MSTSKVMLALLLLPVRIFYDEKRPNCDQSFVAKVAIQANPVVEATNPSVDLTVYFESLCPDSIRCVAISGVKNPANGAGAVKK